MAVKVEASAGAGDRGRTGWEEIEMAQDVFTGCEAERKNEGDANEEFSLSHATGPANSLPHPS